jgi:transcriptional regulator with XRE-family HTH domain
MQKGSDLKTWRENRAMSQAELAAQLDVSRPTIAVWERPDAPLSKMLVLALAALDSITNDPKDFVGKRISRKEAERVRSEPYRKRSPRKVNK